MKSDEFIRDPPIVVPISFDEPIRDLEHLFARSAADHSRQFLSGESDASRCRIVNLRNPLIEISDKVVNPHYGLKLQRGYP
jgi:hypothetical protein